MPPQEPHTATEATRVRPPKPAKGKWKVFLRELSKCGNISAACRASGLDRTNAHHKRAADPDFALLWEQAVETGIDRQEEEADRRATRGVRTLLLFKGQPVRLDKAEGEQVDGWVESRDPKTGDGLGWGFVYETRFSDALLTLLLKANRPDKFADRKKTDVALTTPTGVSVSLTMADAIAAARAARTAREAGQATPPPELAPEVAATLEESAARASVVGTAALEAVEAGDGQ